MKVLDLQPGACTFRNLHRGYPILLSDDSKGVRIGSIQIARRGTEGQGGIDLVKIYVLTILDGCEGSRIHRRWLLLETYVARKPKDLVVVARERRK